MPGGGGGSAAGLIPADALSLFVADAASVGMENRREAGAKRNHRLMKRAAFLLLVLASISGCTGLGTADTGPARAGIAFDGNGEIGSWAEGLADPATGRPATPDDPVRIASVSKTVVAIGVMKLVDEGLLELDRDVADYLGWRLRNPAFPAHPVTLRQLLSHTSGLRDGEDAYVIPLGRSLREALEDGGPWDAAHGPGDGYFSYANFNFPVIASVIERVTGERFDRWMRRAILEPAGIDACFNWPSCTDEAVSRAVVLTSGGQPIRDDLAGKRPDCPVVPDQDGGCDLERWAPGENGALFSPQGGLRISARGLARIGRLLLGGGTIDGTRVLSRRSVEEMLRPAWRFNGLNGSRQGESEGICSYGLAIRILSSSRHCDDDPEGKRRTWLGHAGDAYGLRSGLWIDPERGVGIAYFATGLGDDPPRGKSSFSAAEERAFRRAAALLR
ncbi:MAG: beta-lactamase family protein [Sphingomonas sp.]|nr:beta-lactamase family protein [Sphingomonas sp.]